ncbi:hypothetical protein [Planomicrobium sp. CPCC 101079]|uniref:hypothetical protein n=1 Tax=Planomicrobium sp. CPCC 101079 TaxID=2599618 RepID=UPI0011B428D5|nr:hypothetical protein [Planomicrobium sp. CPCC 101079]TWT04609.1 hypothetical protein FQV28_08375 [Planomicrobium sp. CPCC 101079]
MAKIDTAKEIVAEFPDKGYDAEKLKEEHTQEELDQLQADLRAENSAPPEAPLDSEPEVAKTTTEEPAKKKYKLADSKTSYQEVGFTLIGDQEKELPESPSPFLAGYIRSGFIVEVK